MKTVICSLFILLSLIFAGIGHASAANSLISRKQLIELCNDPELRALRNWDKKIIEEWIKPNKIGFLPTFELRKELEHDGVPRSITQLLPKQFTSNVWIHVYEFQCFNCPPEVGKDFATMIHEEMHNRRRAINRNVKDILHEKSFMEEVAKLVWTPPADKQPSVYLKGSLRKIGNRFQITARMGYVSPTGSQVIGKNLRKTIPATNAAKEQLAATIANWYYESLRRELGFSSN
jgi:hypothetical protein